MLLNVWEVLSLVLWLSEYSLKVSFVNFLRLIFRRAILCSHAHKKTDLSIVLKTEQSTELDRSQAWLTQFWMFLQVPLHGKNSHTLKLFIVYPYYPQVI